MVQHRRRHQKKSVRKRKITTSHEGLAQKGPASPIKTPWVKKGPPFPDLTGNKKRRRGKRHFPIGTGRREKEKSKEKKSGGAALVSCCIQWK